MNSIKLLESFGFEVQLYGGYHPVQILATHKSGLTLYFWSGSDRAILCVFEGVYNSVLSLPNRYLWVDEYTNWEHPKAGYLNEVETKQVFYSLLSEARQYFDELSFVLRCA